MLGPLFEHIREASFIILFSMHTWTQYTRVCVRMPVQFDNAALALRWNEVDLVLASAHYGDFERPADRKSVV